MNQIFLSTLLMFSLNLVSAMDEDVEAPEPIYPCSDIMPKNRWSCWSEGKSWKVCRLCEDLNEEPCKIKSLDKCKCRNIEIDQKGKIIARNIIQTEFLSFSLKQKQ